MSKAATALKLAPEPTRSFAFGSAAPRPRRKALPVSLKSDAELVAEFLAKRAIQICPPRYADGAVSSSGSYDF